MRGRGNLFQVANSGLDEGGRRPAFVDIERAAVVEDQADVVIAAGRVIPRQPVAQHRRLVGEERHDRADHLLVGAEHPLCVDDALGVTSGSRREQNLRDRVAVDASVGVVHRGGRGLGFKSGELCRRQPVRRRGGGHELHAARQHAAECARKRVAVGRKHEPRPHALEDRFERRVVASLQRVRRCDRRVEDAGIHRRERQQRVVDAIARKNDERFLLRQPSIEEALRQASHALERLRVGDARPCAARVPLRNEGSIGRNLRPVLEALGDPLGIGAEPLRRGNVGRS